MTVQSTTPRTEYGEHTICLPFIQDQYLSLIADVTRFRQHLDQQFRQSPELFPTGFQLNYTMKDSRYSLKQNLPLRRITLKNGGIYTIRPSFVLPYMTAKVNDVDDALFLACWVPLWALEKVFKVHATKLYRIINNIGRNSIVGTTIKTAEIRGCGRCIIRKIVGRWDSVCVG